MKTPPRQVGIDFVSLQKANFDPRVVGFLPQSLILLHKVVPVAYVNNAVTLAMVNPSNLVAFDDVRRYIKGAIIEPRVCTEDDFRRFMETSTRSSWGSTRRRRTSSKRRTKKPEERDAKSRDEKKKASSSISRMQSLEDLQNEILSGLEVQSDEEEKPTNTVELTTASEDAPVVRLANNILAMAIKKGASDIHIEPQEKGVVLAAARGRRAAASRAFFRRRFSCR